MGGDPRARPRDPDSADVWTVVVDEGASGAMSIPLTRVKVGGGAPFRTAYVPLAPALAPTATCPS